MIDDGNKVNIEFYVQDKLQCKLSSNSVYHNLNILKKDAFDYREVNYVKQGLKRK